MTASALVLLAPASGKRDLVISMRSSVTTRFERSTLPWASSQIAPRISDFVLASFTSTAARAVNELLVQRSTCGRWRVAVLPLVDRTRGQGDCSSKGLAAMTTKEETNKSVRAQPHPKTLTRNLIGLIMPSFQGIIPSFFIADITFSTTLSISATRSVVSVTTVSVKADQIR